MRSVLEHLPLLHERFARGRTPRGTGRASVVDDPVDHHRCHPVVPEHRSPPAELQVRGDDHRLPLVGFGEHLEE